ncbi:YccS family putative transporter [Neisseria chenwenguii]|uniref:TIGR01666 family membrane protein n=1 Tax=Neisseria chenwenguii TaxID=1853278 RepID=A0A220S4M2_9NEIS|nr:YccS family putative transporter [Neisseria chenwenguii]ASK28469.1 TIGR01666 family membrane protein [Neisseria chenwenguii]ROV57078.1 TIGR01666 family membrane protein [Neisseria chenwenguii]
MRTPPLKPLLIAALPVFASVFTAATLVWHFDAPKLAMPFVLGIIAGGLVDLDNRLTGRLKNIVVTVALFTLASLTAQMTLGTGLPFIAAMTGMTFCFTIMGAVGLRYRTFAFGALAVAVYTSLTYTPESFWLTNPLMILCGTLLYSAFTLVFHMVFPHRPVQESVAAAYEALGGYFDAKADFFDPDEAAWLGNRQIDLAMRNTGVVAAFNQCRAALFYRLRGQHRHPRTARMLRYYFAVQDIHERISSAHMDYAELAEKLKNTDLIFRIHRLLEMQGQACRNVAEGLRGGRPYKYSKRLARAVEGCRQSLAHFSDGHKGTGEVHNLQQLLNNLISVDYQLKHLENSSLTADADTDTRIAALEGGGLKTVWQTVRGQLNFESSVFRHAVRLSIVVAVACAIVEVLQLNLGYWILLTALFVAQPNYTATKSRVYQRIAGTVLGVIVGSLVPYFTPSVETKLWIVIAATTLFFVSRSYKYSFSTFFITIQALTSFSLAGLDVYSAMPVRIIDTVIGAVLAWAAASHLWPDWKYLTLERTAAQAVSGNGAYLGKIADQLRHGSRDDVEYRTVRRRAHEYTAALGSTLSDMSSEPKKYSNRLQEGFTLLQNSYALTGYISALGAYRSHMADSGNQAFAEQFYQTARQTAGLLETLPQQSSESFQTALSRIRSDLETLRSQAGDERQSNILWQQLSLIARQLEPCYQALRHCGAGKTAE